MPYEKKLYPDLDLSTPDKFFAEVEKRLGTPLDDSAQVATTLAVILTGDIEGVFATAVHDCDKCPIYEMCGPEASPHYKARKADAPQDEGIAALLADVDVDIESDPDRDTSGGIPPMFLDANWDGTKFDD